MMVVEFSRRLREELGKLQDSFRQRRSQVDTSNMTRMSLDSIRSLQVEGPMVLQTYAEESFAESSESSQSAQWR